MVRKQETSALIFHHDHLDEGEGLRGIAQEISASANVQVWINDDTQRIFTAQVRPPALLVARFAAAVFVSALPSACAAS